MIKSATVAPGGRSALRAYVMLNALQFLPLGLHIPVEILLMQARGLTSTEIGLVIGIAALVTAVLELPTGGLADTIGRRGVLLAGGALTLASFVVFAVAGTLAAFVAGSFVFATGRALQSGPLKAWFIDTVKTTVPEPEHDDVLTRGLALGGTAIGLSLALGAVSGGLLAELGAGLGLPSQGEGAVYSLSVPFLVGAVLLVSYLLGVQRLLVGEPPTTTRAVSVIRQVPTTIADGVKLVVGDPVVASFAARWALVPIGFLAFDLLTPVRLQELIADPARAATILGVLVAVCYAGEGAAAPLAMWMRRRMSPLVGGALATVAAGMAFAVAGFGPTPVLLAATVLAFVFMAPSNALLGPPLHARIDPKVRSTLLSVQSMIQQGAIAVGAVGIGGVAAIAGTPVAFLAAGLLTALAAVPLIGVARWRQRPVRNPDRQA